MLTLVLASADCAARILGADTASFPLEGLWTIPEAPCTDSGANLGAKTGSTPPLASWPRRSRIRDAQSSTQEESSAGPQPSHPSMHLSHCGSPPVAEVARRAASMTPNPQVQITWRAGPPNITDIIDTANNRELSRM